MDSEWKNRVKEKKQEEGMWNIKGDGRIKRRKKR